MCTSRPATPNSRPLSKHGQTIVSTTPAMIHSRTNQWVSGVLMFRLTHNRTFWKRVNPGNHLHWYWQPIQRVHFLKPDQVWPALVVSELFFYCFRNKSFTFFNRSGTASVDQKSFRLNCAEIRCGGGDEWRQPIRCVVYNWWFSSFVAAYLYVPINLVLCGLLSLKIIVRVCIHRHVS